MWPDRGVLEHMVDTVLYFEGRPPCLLSYFARRKKPFWFYK